MTSGDESRADTKPEIAVQYRGRVSRALWPTAARKALATGRAAQGRRSLIIKGAWWLLSLDLLRVRHPFMLVLISMLTGGEIVAALGTHLWHLLLLSPALLLIILVLPTITRSCRTMMRASTRTMFRVSSAGIYQRGEPAGSILRSPETPLPGEPPLVRVLETVDLSRTDVEHFLDRPGI